MGQHIVDSEMGGCTNLTDDYCLEKFISRIISLGGNFVLVDIDGYFIPIVNPMKKLFLSLFAKKLVSCLRILRLPSFCPPHAPASARMTQAWRNPLALRYLPLKQ